MQSLNELVGRLREELNQYGEMLARFEEIAGQRLKPFEKDASLRLRALDEQREILKDAVNRREQAQRDFARNAQLRENADLAEIIPILPPDYQLLIGALAEENKALSSRVQACDDPRNLGVRGWSELGRKWLAGFPIGPVERAGESVEEVPGFLAEPSL